MGCGRVGSTVAHILEDQGHSVAVIDQDPEAFRKLRSGFKGGKVTGIGFDRDVLVEAGIEGADAFAAVSSGDNSNVIAARVARESFGVQRVVARMRADDTGFANLAIAGDWIDNPQNLGSFEASVMSGKLASRALTGLPKEILRVAPNNPLLTPPTNWPPRFVEPIGNQT